MFIVNWRAAFNIIYDPTKITFKKSKMACLLLEKKTLDEAE